MWMNVTKLILCDRPSFLLNPCPVMKKRSDPPSSRNIPLVSTETYQSINIPSPGGHTQFTIYLPRCGILNFLYNLRPSHHSILHHPLTTLYTPPGPCCSPGVCTSMEYSPRHGAPVFPDLSGVLQEYAFL